MAEHSEGMATVADANGEIVKRTTTGVEHQVALVGTELGEGVAEILEDRFAEAADYFGQVGANREKAAKITITVAIVSDSSGNKLTAAFDGVLKLPPMRAHTADLYIVRKGGEPIAVSPFNPKQSRFLFGD